MDSKNPDDGHTWAITIDSRTSSKVVGDAHYKDAPEWHGNPTTIFVRAWSLRDALDKVSVREYMHKAAGVRVLTDEEGTQWVHDIEDDTYQPFTGGSAFSHRDGSVPMPKIVFERVYPELYKLFQNLA